MSVPFLLFPTMPNPWVMENATSADKKRGRASVKGTPTTIIPIAANANGIGTTAAGTATIIQPKANAIGTWVLTK